MSTIELSINLNHHDLLHCVDVMLNKELFNSASQNGHLPLAARSGKLLKLCNALVDLGLGSMRWEPISFPGANLQIIFQS